MTRKNTKQDAIAARGTRGKQRSPRKSATAINGERKANGNGAGHVLATNGKQPSQVNGHSHDGEKKKLNGQGLNGREEKALARSVARQSKAQLLVARDRQLVERCMLGEVSQWSAIYRQCHESLLSAIRAFLGRLGNDADLVEEIAARTWYAVVKDDFKLLDRFDPKFGCRLTTFLSLLAKNEARLLMRSERRRKSREQAASRPEQANDSRYSITDEEFIATLSPSERTFCHEVLLVARKDELESQYTRCNHWQLRHRIRKKLEQYLSYS